MLSTRGWAAAGTVGALSVLWIALGEDELAGLALFLLGALLAGKILSRRRRHPDRFTRSITPSKLHEGEIAQVHLELTPSGPLGGAWLEDGIPGLGNVRFAVGPGHGATPLTAQYQVRCRPRGVYQVGPAVLAVADPFGLTERHQTLGDPGRLVVFPAIETLQGFPTVRGQDPAVHASKPSFSPRGGEDFFTLREYQSGDDLRRVHWPSSAKRDELMIRQLETPWRSRALVFFDPRQPTFPTSESFEAAVRGTASILHHFSLGGYAPAVWLGGEAGGISTHSYSSAMDQLAGIRPISMLDTRVAATRIRRQGASGGTLALIIGNPDDVHLAVFRALDRAHHRVLVAAVTEAGEEVVEPFRRTGASAVVVPPSMSWSEAWNLLMRGTWSTVSAGSPV